MQRLNTSLVHPKVVLCCLRDATSSEVETRLSFIRETRISKWRRRSHFPEETRLCWSGDAALTLPKRRDSVEVEMQLSLCRRVQLCWSGDTVLLFCQDASLTLLKRRGPWSGDAGFAFLKRRGTVRREACVLGVLPRVWWSWHYEETRLS